MQVELSWDNFLKVESIRERSNETRARTPGISAVRDACAYLLARPKIDIRPSHSHQQLIFPSALLTRAKTGVIPRIARLYRDVSFCDVYDSPVH